MIHSEVGNKKLIMEYPFLLIRNVFTDEPPIEDRFYKYTYLDDVPEGWREAFSDQLYTELKAALVRAGRLDDYRILQITEKYGELRWYDHGGTRKPKTLFENTERSARGLVSVAENLQSL